MDTSAKPPEGMRGVDEMPKQVKIVRILVIFQLIMAVVFIAVLIWMVDATPSGAFLEGFREGLIGDGYSYTYEDAGAMSATPMITALFSVFIVVALMRRTRRWAMTAYILLGLEVALGLAAFTIPIFALLNLVLLLSNPAKKYLNFSTTEMPSSKAPGTDAS